MNPSLTILQTCFSRSWGGLEIQALEISSTLDERGHEVWVGCFPESRLESACLSRKLRVLPLNVRGYFHPVLIWKLSRFISLHHVDIVHSHLSRDIATLVPAIKLAHAKPPLILSKRVGSYIEKKDPLHRFTYANVSRVLPISSVIHKNVLDTTPVPPDRVTLLHDAVNTDLFHPAKVDRSVARHSFGYRDDEIVIGLLGRFSPGKGHEDLLEAGARLKKNHQNIRFLIVGEASFGEEEYGRTIRSLSSNLGLDDIVTFAGYRSDTPGILSAIDILAFPSHAESFGVVLIEAMAMELPVVSTNCDGVLDVVADEVTGLYVNPKRPIELADALDRLIRDPEMRTRLGKEGRKRVLDLFDQKKQIDRLEEIYREVLA